MPEIQKLKELEKYYQISMDWYYREKLYEHEYIEQIGEYKDWTPEEIAEEIFKLIRNL